MEWVMQYYSGVCVCMCIPTWYDAVFHEAIFRPANWSLDGLNHLRAILDKLIDCLISLGWLASSYLKEKFSINSRLIFHQLYKHLMKREMRNRSHQARVHLNSYGSQYWCSENFDYLIRERERERESKICRLLYFIVCFARRWDEIN